MFCHQHWGNLFGFHRLHWCCWRILGAKCVGVTNLVITKRTSTICSHSCSAPTSTNRHQHHCHLFWGETELIVVKLTIQLIAVFLNVSRFSTQPRKEIDFTARKTTWKLCFDDLKVILSWQSYKYWKHTFCRLFVNLIYNFQMLQIKLFPLEFKIRTSFSLNDESQMGH